jgi:PIN domain nuclease of toxin-antitoxin system
VEAVTDTHALMWFASGATRKLGREALRLYRLASERRARIHVPALCLVEVFEQVRRGRYRLQQSPREWLRLLQGTTSFRVAALDVDVVLAAEAMYDIPERTDRLIAATARSLELPLITRDPEIARVAQVEVIW